MDNIHYRLEEVLDAHREHRPGEETPALLEQIKSHIEGGLRVFVPYPDCRGRWRLHLDPDRNIVWRCHVLG